MIRVELRRQQFLPYKRNVRPWAIPGTPGLEHRIGGLEKQNETGNVAYDPENHDLMTQLRAQKVAGITVPDQFVDHQEGADVLVLSWGGTYGPVHAGVRRVRAIGAKVAHAHVRWLSPFPANLGDVLRSYDRVLVPEMNSGHLLQLVRARYLVDAVGYNRITGKPFKVGDCRRDPDGGVTRGAAEADDEGVQVGPGSAGALLR